MVAGLPGGLRLRAPQVSSQGGDRLRDGRNGKQLSSMCLRGKPFGAKVGG